MPRFATSVGQLTTLTGLFARNVHRFGERPAVSDGRRALTYRQLDEASTALARRLTALGVGLEDRVGLYMARGTDVVVSVLGILKAGAAYVAVDPRYPDSRRDHMLIDCDAKAVVVQADWTTRLSHLDMTTITFDDSRHPAGNPADDHVNSRTAASVLYTSGSAGQPKAIVLEHGNLVSFVLNPVLPQLTPTDRTGQISSISFDAFHFELWSALVAGAEVVILPPVPELLAGDFQRQLRRRRITAMLVPTMVLNHVVREDRDAFAPLRILCAGGDVLLPSAVRELLGGAFDGELYNLYGPAEITTACTAHRVTAADAEADTVPIGRPLAAVTVLVLDPDGRPVESGVVGELYIGGPGVARGYLNRPDLTREWFVANPDPAGPDRLYRTGDLARRRDDGLLEFVGRVDDQVKIRGYRVEPGEVQRTLQRCSSVREAVVLVDTSGADPRLAAFVELEDPASLQDVRREADEQLPEFLMPQVFLSVDRIPATEHGKRDTDALRQLLEEDDRRRSESEPPATDTERWLAGVWEELLTIEGVSRSHDFFDLGGHSLLAFRTLNRIRRTYQVNVEFDVVLGRSVLWELAASIDQAVQADRA